MKYVVASAIFVCITILAKAQQSKPAYTYRQKQLADSLKLLFPDLQNGKDTSLPDGNTMPVIPLPNDEHQVGVTAKGTIYKMKPDNMLRLEPNETNAAMPNAFSGKLYTEPGYKKP